VTLLGVVKTSLGLDVVLTRSCNLKAFSLAKELLVVESPLLEL
jgi:hypothetical protein